MANTPRVVTGANQDITGRTITLDYQAPAYATPLAITTTKQYTSVNVAALTGVMTVTAGTTNPLIGDQLEIMFTGDTVDRVVTFSTGIEGIANLTVTGNARAIANFRFNGTKWIYVSSAATSQSDVQTPVFASPLSVTTTARATKVIPGQLTGALTVNLANVGTAGDELKLVFGTDGTQRVVTFGTNLKSSGTMTIPAGKFGNISFTSDGIEWVAGGREITA